MGISRPRGQRARQCQFWQIELVKSYLTGLCRSNPASASAPSFLKPVDHAPPRHRSRSRSREPRRRGPPPPRPTVEDELVSLAREHRDSPLPSYDPPLRGIIDQNPIILEADVPAAEAARLHAAPCSKEVDDNGERRFVLIPRSDTHSPNHEDEPLRGKRSKQTGSSSSKDGGKLKPEPAKEKETGRPPIERRRSRQDLPSLQTKVPRDFPSQFRRSTSAYASTPKDYDETPRPQGPRTPAAESFLSPDVQRGHGKDYFGSTSTPRHASQDFAPKSGTPSNDKRGSREGSTAGSRPGTPLSEKRNSGSFETDGRSSRRSTNDKPTRTQQLPEEHVRRTERHHSPHPDRHRHSRGTAQPNRRYYSSSEEDISNSDSDRRYNRRHHSSLLPEDEHRRSPSRSNRSSIERPIERPSGRPGSRYASPLPSPKISPSQLPPVDQFERWEPHPHDSRVPNSRPVSPGGTQETPRASDRLNPIESAAPRPGSRQSNAVPIPAKKRQPTPPPGSIPIPIPSRIDLHSPGETRRPPSMPQYDDNKPSSARPSASSWQPPTFKPPSSNLEKPVGSYRRYSEDMERGAIVPLPTCPRTTFSRGRNDWLTLPQCPSFDMCPSCFNSTIAPTEFRSHFVQAPRRSSSTEVLCDFGSSPWYRIAWLLTLKERRRDLKLFYGLANIAASAPPCLGKHEAVRQWHSIVDPKTRTPIQNFDVCYSCVKSVETLLPAIRGIFVRTDNPHAPQGAGRVCDLRFDSKRFIQYFDALETTADKADEDDVQPDTRSLASLVRRMATINECQQDKELTDARWHVITQLPEFTVCEECFDDVVWPELEDRKAIPAMFNKTQQRIPKASCQLYSERMRDIFSTAIDGNDYKLLASTARERKTVEAAHKANVEKMKRQMKTNPQAAGREIERLTAEWKKWE